MLLDNTLQFGGFPRIYNIKETLARRKLLQNYYESILLKDCIANHAIRDIKAFMNLTHYLISNVSQPYSYNSLGKALGHDETTIQNFIQILQNAYLMEEIKNFSFSLKTQSKTKKKTYCIDNGLITAITFKFSKNYGKLLENFVYTELRKKFEDIIYFHNDYVECDFILYGQERMAIQVCYQLELENRDREIKGLVTAMEQFSISKGVIITYDYEEQIDKNIMAYRVGNGVLISLIKYGIEE